MKASPTNHNEWAWLGERYAGGRNGIRLLVLGESSYGENLRATPPRVLIEHYLESSARWHNTYTRFLKILTGQTAAPDDRQRKAIWGELAFTNYLTRAAGFKAGDRPTEDQWEESLSDFFGFLTWLKPSPDAVIVWGMPLWKALEHNPGCRQCVRWNHMQGMGYIHWPGGAPMPAVGIAHPSAPVSGRLKWKKRLGDFLEKQRPADRLTLPSA